MRIRPGTDAWLLAGLARLLLEAGARPQEHVAAHLAPGALEAVAAAADPFLPDRVSGVTGVPEATIRELAQALLEAPTAAVYGRMGTTTAGIVIDGTVTSFGTAASWWVTVVNILSGNLDRPGGVMWPTPAAGGPTTAGRPGTGRGVRIPGSSRTRVRGLPSALGELPVATLAEEIDTPDAEGTRIRALVTIAGNPVVSTPDGGRLEAALASLDLLVSLDAYVTETSRHAHVVLPAPSPLARGHYDVVFANLAVRNVARWTPPSIPLAPDERDEGDTLLRLACVALGDALDTDAMDDLVAAEVARRASTDEASRAHGRDPADLLAAVAPRRRQERLLDLMIRSGPFGDGFGGYAGGLTLAALEAAPHGVDLGPLQSRLPEVLRTPSGRIELAPPQLLAEATRMAEAMVPLHPGRRPAPPRRQAAAGGPPGTAQQQLVAAQPAVAVRWREPLHVVGPPRRRRGSVPVGRRHRGRVQPHRHADGDGRGERRGGAGSRLPPARVGAPGAGDLGSVAAAEPGVNSNRLTPSGGLDALSGTAVLNGIPVTVSAAG